MADSDSENARDASSGRSATQADLNEVKQISDCGGSIDQQQIALPADILLDIFKRLPEGEKSLRNCRQVCKLWKETIDSSPELMRKITIRISDLAGFLKLKNIAPNAKVVRFQGSEQTYKESEMDKLLQLIGSSVEKVIFRIDIPSAKLMNEKRLLVRILQDCNKLVEFDFAFTSTSRMPYSLAKLSNTRLDLSRSNVNILSILLDLNKLNVQDLDRVGTFILMFARLSQLKLAGLSGHTYNRNFTALGQRPDYTPVLKMMIDCIRKFRSQLQPKREDVFFQLLEYPVDWDMNVDQALQLKFLFLCKKYDVDFHKPHEMVTVRAYTLHHFQPTEELSIDNEDNDPKYLEAVKCIRLPIGNQFGLDDNVINRRINLCVNLKKVDFSVHGGRARQEDILFLRNLNYIEELGITGLPNFEDNAYPFTDEIFSVFLPTLKSLTMEKQCFESADLLSSIVSSYPGLEYLSITFCKGLNVSFICNLTRLERLSSLELVDLWQLWNLTSKAFLEPCKVEEKENGESRYLPAIASFKQLKTLKIDINELALLNDEAVAAVTKNPTLNTLEIMRGGNGSIKNTHVCRVNAAVEFVRQNSNINVKSSCLWRNSKV